ncbi:MAG: hypothetical protein EHM30_09800 [Desulfobacteraceae bacterium]|nr:MAG: hypothetical protein EHM30_09800 [Desulfobacteraceae bacterium]
MMNIDSGLLSRFEAGLDPQNLKDSPVPAVILGFGEISTVFKIEGCPDMAYKRMPLFKDIASAGKYAGQFLEYCNLLAESGLKLPESGTEIVAVPGRPVVLYIAQKILPPECFAHKLIHVLNPDETGEMLKNILLQIGLVWDFNRRKKPLFEIALDGQLSNWVLPENLAGELYFVDTSTPLYRKNGIEQLDPELLLKSAPGFLRWMLRLFFLKDVMNRYYDRRQVCIDLAANLFKEQKPEMVLPVVEIMNGIFFEKNNPLTEEEVKKYYSTDRKIWALFLAFRRIDRFITANIMRKRYEFILPGKIKR